jgi:pyridoxal phosphate enzyme (YggS family)
MDIRDNIARVHNRMAAACARAGRRMEDVRLIAVSKTFSAGHIREAYDAGLREFGESRVQEAAAKRPALADFDITWHLIGHLQTNKARQARALFDWVHSVDSVRLAEKLAQAAPSESRRLPVLLEVNLGGEEAKFGLAEREVLTAAEAVSRYPSLDLRGWMLIPPFFEDAEKGRPFFRRLRKLAETICACGAPYAALRELSMGMSHDFEVAIEEGATMIRVGTAIFGSR